MRALRQFWSQGTSSKIVVLATAGVIVLIGLFGVLLIGNSLQGGNTETNSQATRGALAGNSTPTATHGSNASPASTLAGTATAGTPTTAPGGPPQLGAPLADFVTAYGQPTQQPNVQQSTSATDDFWGNTQQTVLIDTTFTNGLATQYYGCGSTRINQQPDLRTHARFSCRLMRRRTAVPPRTRIITAVWAIWCWKTTTLVSARSLSRRHSLRRLAATSLARILRRPGRRDHRSLARPSQSPRPGWNAVREPDSIGPHVPGRGADCRAAIPES